MATLFYRDGSQSTPFSRAALAIVCILIFLTPLARGSVNLWAETVIQIFTLLALLILVLEKISSKYKIAVLGSVLDRALAAAIALTLISAGASSYGFVAVEGSLMFITYIAVFYITINAVRSRKEQRFIIYVIIFTASVISLIAFMKALGINIFSWWNYPDLKYPIYFLSGPYGNHNHMAGFLEMAIPLLLILFMTRDRSRESVTGFLALVFILLIAQGMTLSRGGWASTAGSLVFMLVVLLMQRDFYRKKLLLSIAAMVFITSFLLLVSTPVVERLITLTQENRDESMGGRVVCWQGTMHLIENHLFSGTGPGTFADAYPRYQPAGLNVLFHHAHNDYLEIISGVGVVIIPVIIWMIWVLYRNGFERMKSPSRQTRGVALGAMASIFAILLHSFGDFNLQIPANALLFSVICSLPCQNTTFRSV